MVITRNKTDNTKKSVSKAVTAKKVPVKKTTASKTVAAKKVTVKKVAINKATVTKKVPVKKVTASKVVATKKTPVRKVTASKAVTTKKVPVKKATVSKTVVTKNGPVKKNTTKEKSIFLKNTLSDIFLLYKNIIHWNISKLIIFIWSSILWVISTLPLILIFFIYTMFSDVSINMLLSWIFGWTFLSNFFWNIILFIIILVFIIIFSYSNFLLIKLNNWYKSWKKLNFKNNDYFDYRKIIKFFNLSLLNIGILILPIVLFLLLMWNLYLISWWFDQYSFSWGVNYFVIFSLLSFIVCSVLMAYLYYRVVFSYFILWDDKYYDKWKSALSYVKESFKKTKKIKNFFKLLVITFIVFIITIPLKYVDSVLENNSDDLANYYTYLNTWDEWKAYLTSSNLNYYQSLEIKFQWYNNDKIHSESNTNTVYLVLFNILNFIFLYWLFVMVLSSFYKRELK